MRCRGTPKDLADMRSGASFGVPQDDSSSVLATVESNCPLDAAISQPTASRVSKERTLAFFRDVTAFAMTESPMQSGSDDIRSLTRRHLFGQCGLGLGSIALASLMSTTASPRTPKAPRRRPEIDLANPLAPRQGPLSRASQERHLPVHGRRPQPARAVRLQAQARRAERPADPRVVHRRQAVRLHGQLRGKERPSCLARARKFARHGQSGAWVSRTAAAHGDDRRRHLARPHRRAPTSSTTRPAKLFMNTGSAQFGRPSMGAWVTYGIGSESQRPARLRRAAVRPARPARRRGQLGQRLSAHHLPGRALPRHRRPDPQPDQPRRASPPTGSATRSTPSAS